MLQSILLAAVMAGSPEAIDRRIVEKPPASIFNETAEEKAVRMNWWETARFGMFVHFGVYTMPARGEWAYGREQMTTEEYRERYIRRFNPDLFDAREWVGRAKKAGMKYVVLTAKHHDGFCMWDTDTTDFKITNTPFGRDLIREYVDACREAGIKVGIYFSIIDWTHPDFHVDFRHRERPYPEENEARWTDADYHRLNDGRDMAKYRAYMFAQVKELLTRYGEIAVIWYDCTHHGKYGKNWKDWDAVELLKMTRRLQPGIIYDNRLGLTGCVDGGDYSTPEQVAMPSAPFENGSYQRYWETCQTMSDKFGYVRGDSLWKDRRQTHLMLVGTVAKGGNLLLNVAPNGRGAFPKKAIERLEWFSDWMRMNERSIRGCGQAPEGFVAPAGTCLTYNPQKRTLYIHLVDYPTQHLLVEFADRISYAQFVHDDSEVAIKGIPDRIKAILGKSAVNGSLELPIVQPDDCDFPVIECFLK